MRVTGVTKKTAAMIAVTILGVLTTGVSVADLVIERSSSNERAAGATFDLDQYTVMTDNEYSPIVEHGKSREFEAAPSYGDTMSLTDALDLLVPDGWKALRNQETEAAIDVTWSIQNGTWIDVLRNLGSRHGLQFHIDYLSNRVYIREGRKLLVEPASEVATRGRYVRKPRVLGAVESTLKNAQVTRQSQKSKPQSQKSKPQSQTTQSANRPHEQRKVSIMDMDEEVTFDVKGGDDGEKVMRDLALMLGYDKLYWMTEPLSFSGSQVVQGNPEKVVSRLSSTLKVKSCVYDGQSNAIAVVSKKTECPQ